MRGLTTIERTAFVLRHPTAASWSLASCCGREGAIGVAALFAALVLPSASAQAQENPGASQAPETVAIHPTQADSGVFTLHITAREVVLDLIALNGHGGPVPNLTGTELQVSYSGIGDQSRKHRHVPATQPQIAPISSLHIIDPNALLSSAADTHAGFQITSSCLERSTLHYQLTFRPGPDGWTSGFHQVSVTTTRNGVRLFYRRRYYVGETVAPKKLPVRGSHSIEKLLRKDACNYPDTPLSISLHARLIETGHSDVLRFQVAVDASSLSYVTVDADAEGHQMVSVDRRVQIDYGVCAFNAAGQPIGFFQAPLDRVLTSADYARALALGFTHILELKATPSLALARIVVRDRATGNLGATDVVLGGKTPSVATVADSGASSVPGTREVPTQDRLAQETASNLEDYSRFVGRIYLAPPKGPIGSFGSVVPAANSFCGDVYELEDSLRLLPEFRELDPIGSIYTYSLDVPSQNFTNTDGIPGVTPRTNLFGIDYHAVFWIRNAGDYQFRMVSDDGAILWIDDRELINLDGIHPAAGGSGTIHLDPGPHTTHVAYYQGAIVSVALLLWVQPPGEEDWKIFDLRNFASPSPGAQ